MVIVNHLAADRLLDEAWRGGVGTAAAYAEATRVSHEAGAQERVIEDAKMIVSERRDCSPDEALVRLIFVSNRTNRKLREIAWEVVAAAAADAQRLAVVPPRLYRFTL